MRRVSELIPSEGIGPGKCPFKEKNNRLNIVALGDVGSILLTGLRLMGGDVIQSIGIFDANEKTAQRFEIEMNQIGWPFEDCQMNSLPFVEKISEEQLFDCDVFVFCASRGVPSVGATGDVRMAQLEANRKIVEYYALMAKQRDFRGMFAVVSDPVDPLCKAALKTSGLMPCQVEGFGLGVMNMRARYYAMRDKRFNSYLTEGRAFGPHGSDLVIANSIENYDDELSRQLTDITVKANLEIRELGFKPYFAPALSSGAISLLLMLRKQWHFSSIFFGEAFLGIKNRMTDEGPEFEDIPLPDELFARIEVAYRNLCQLEKKSEGNSEEKNETSGC